MIKGKVLILDSNDMYRVSANPKAIDLKRGVLKELYTADVVLLVEKDRTTIIKNRYGQIGVAPKEKV